jgi:hypothetical protein
MRRRTAAPYHAERLETLRSSLVVLEGRNVEVYLSLVSDAQRSVLANAGLLDDFARWRVDVARLTAARGVRFHDLVDLGAARPFDPGEGSTDYWLDNLHYTPALGRDVLRELGLRSPELSAAKAG